MPRIGRIVATDLPHHITQRGNYRQDIFLDDEDRKQYLWWVNEYSNKYETSILSYCLMQNHVHFIVTPHRKDSLANTFKAVQMRYSQYFNKKMKTSGHLWQGRFYSAVLDESHLIATARYVERNPVRANIVQKPWQWRWSSAEAHINKEKSPLIKLGNLFEFIEIPGDSWKQFIDSEEDKKMVDNIRKHTQAGRPLGAATFIEKLEKRLGKRLHALGRGRPKINK